MVEIVAEIGVNHNNDLSLAKELCTAAMECGVDWVKFQNYLTEDFIDRRNNPEAQYKLFKSLEWSGSDFEELTKWCNEQYIPWFTTPTLSRVDEAVKLGSRILKCGSDEATNTDLLLALKKTGKPLIISTGMMTFNEVNQAQVILHNLTFMHCTSQYPTSEEDAHMGRLSKLIQVYGECGYSDHTLGSKCGVIAVSMGARILEKHFTLDHDMEGPDHSMSTGPVGMNEYVKTIRNTELAIGDYALDHTDKEMKARKQWMSV